MRISKENWLSSKKKWKLIIKNIRNRNKIYGDHKIWFYDTPISGQCGYCKEKTKQALSIYCQRGCGLFLTCTRHYDPVCDLLRKGNYKAALPHAKAVLKAIMEDEKNVY